MPLPRRARGGAQPAVRRNNRSGCSRRSPLKDAAPRRELGARSPVGDPSTVLGLPVQPERGAMPKNIPSRSAVSARDGALRVHQLTDPSRRDIDVCDVLADADAHGLNAILQQDLTRMDLLEQRGRVSHSWW